MSSEQFGLVMVLVFLLTALGVVWINLWHEGATERRDAERRNHEKRNHARRIK